MLLEIMEHVRMVAFLELEAAQFISATLVVLESRTAKVILSRVAVLAEVIFPTVLSSSE